MEHSCIAHDRHVNLACHTVTPVSFAIEIGRLCVICNPGHLNCSSQSGQGHMTGKDVWLENKETHLDHFYWQFMANRAHENSHLAGGYGPVTLKLDLKG